MTDEERAQDARGSHSEFADQINRRVARGYAALTLLAPLITAFAMGVIVRTWHPRLALAITASVVALLVTIAVLRRALVAPVRRRAAESLDSYCVDHGIEAVALAALASDDARFLRSVFPLMKNKQ